MTSPKTESPPIIYCAYCEQEMQENLLKFLSHEWGGYEYVLECPHCHSSVKLFYKINDKGLSKIFRMIVYKS